MFGTTLAVVDGYAKTLDESFQLLRRSDKSRTEKSLSMWTVAQAFSGMAIILFFQSSLGPMLSFAMTPAFVTTPFFAWLNFDLVRGGLSVRMNMFAWIGMSYLSTFSIGYVIQWLFFQVASARPVGVRPSSARRLLETKKRAARGDP